jgi:hypothetical protein
MSTTPHLEPDDWRRIREALRYLGRDLHHRSFSVSSDRRELLWQEMDRCLALADRLSDLCDEQELGSSADPPAG